MNILFNLNHLITMGGDRLLYNSTNIIDFVSVKSEEEYVFLSIADELDWIEEKNHLWCKNKGGILQTMCIQIDFINGE